LADFEAIPSRNRSSIAYFGLNYENIPEMSSDMDFFCLDIAWLLRLVYLRFKTKFYLKRLIRQASSHARAKYLDQRCKLGYEKKATRF
jgi:hypothetical protein